jgi:hypothetical protein
MRLSQPSGLAEDDEGPSREREALATLNDDAVYAAPLVTLVTSISTS